MNFGGVRQEQYPWILEWRLSTETVQSEAETGSVDKEETTEISVNIQDDSDDGDSRSVSPAPSVSSNSSCSEGGAKLSRKRAQKSTKTFVDNKREKLQKILTGHPASAFAEAVRTPASHDGRSNQKR